MDKNMTVALCKERLEEMLKTPKMRRIDDVYEDLSIFDWWKDTLSVANQKDMLSFLKRAEQMGFHGYCCFKVGVPMCANGMWANKELSTNGYSPDGDFLYKSFTPEYTEWYIEADGQKIDAKSFWTLKSKFEEAKNA